MPVLTRGSASVRGRVPFEDAVRRRVLENGAELLVLENHFNPTVAVSGSLHGGSLFAPVGKRLLASMTAAGTLTGAERTPQHRNAGSPCKALPALVFFPP